jgi:proline-specific peptidase
LERSEEGRAAVPGGHVWYRIVGSGERIPLLAVHGGPGAGHDYLESLEALADAGRQVVFRDQLGCGRSEAPEDPSLYRIERYVEEIATVRAELDLDEVHLLGQSVGGWSAIEYMLTRPTGVKSLNLASTSPGVPCLLRGLARLRAQLPEEVRETLDRHEKAGDLQDPEYVAAATVFDRLHVCRLDPFPEALLRTIDNTNRSAVYGIMHGPNEFVITGNYRDWDRRDRLHQISAPALVTCGRYDKFVPECSEELHRGIAGSEFRVFEHSSHMSHLEEPGDFLQVVGGFLDRVEEQVRRS